MFPSQPQPGAPRSRWAVYARHLALLAIAYNPLEGLVSMAFGWADSSVALFGFGADSLIEVGTSLLVLWRLREEQGACAGSALPRERRATLGIGILFLLLAAGTAAGGWRIIRTLGHKVVKLQPINGFAAETSSATVIGLATLLGIPVSTTHNISAAIMGVGAAKRFNAVRWTVVERMMWAWFLTLPVTAALSYLAEMFSRSFGWIQ